MMSSYKHIQIRDIERCPFIPFDDEYDEWNRKNDERLEKISEERKHLLQAVISFKKQHMISVENIHRLADYIIESLRDEE